MKYGFIIIFGIMLFACRSSRNVSSLLDSTIQTEKQAQLVRIDSTRAESIYSDSASTNTEVVEYAVTTAYRPDGTIQAVQEHWRRTGSAQLSVSSGRTAALSLIRQQTDSGSISKSYTKASLKEQKTTDSRPVQGTEWFWVGIVILIFIFLLIKYGKSIIGK